MKNESFRIMSFVLIGILCFSVPCVYAETIVLKSGKTVEGKLFEKTDKYVKIDFQGMPLTYFFDEIKSIDGKEFEKVQERALLNNLNDPNPIVRLETATLLGDEYLIKALRDDSLLVRYFAVMRLMSRDAVGKPYISEAIFGIKDTDVPIISILIASSYSDNETLNRLYRSDNKYRKEAFAGILSSSTYDQQRQLAAGALNDTDNKIRLLAILTLRDLMSHDSEARRLYDKFAAEDALIKRFSGYLDCLKSKETIMKSFAALNDTSIEVRDIFLYYVCKTYYETMDESLAPLIYEATKNDNVIIRLTSSLVFLNDKKYIQELQGIVAQALDEFISNRGEEDAFRVIIALQASEETIPGIQVLIKIFNDQRPLIHWGIIAVLRQMVYYDKSLNDKEKLSEIMGFLKENDPMEKFKDEFKTDGQLSLAVRQIHETARVLKEQAYPPRRLSADQIEIISSSLREHPAHNISITSTAGDSETLQFATDFKKALESGGWNVFGVNEKEYSGQMRGVLFKTGSNNPLPPQVMWLTRAFLKAKITVGGLVDHQFPFDKCELIIYPRAQ